jgi:uncharacterized protein
MSSLPEAFFLSREPAGQGVRYCVLHRPTAATALRGGIVYVHPWCEEMNKSRRMAALQARALAEQGWAVLQIDLLGCGDSSGDFAQASWQAWVDDVVAAAQWISSRFDAPLWLWGCLLANEAAAKLAGRTPLLFWQPAAGGKALLQQFLMLKLAGLMQDGKAQGVMQGLRDELAAGRAVEVAGYTLSPALADGLAAATLLAPGTGTRAVWLELLPQRGATPSPALQHLHKAWTDAGHAVQLAVVKGPPFWQTTEIEDASELIAATSERLLGETTA